MTVFAIREAPTAVRFIAVGAVDRAAGTQAGAAGVTGRGLVPIEQIATVTARESLPVFQRDVGRTRIVGLQNLPHDHEEVAQASSFQGGRNGEPSVSFAQTSVRDMGMTEAGITGRRHAITGPDPVAGGVAERIDFERDLVTAQIDFLQRDRIGGHFDQPFPEVEFDAGKLVLQPDQFADQVPERQSGGTATPAWVLQIVMQMLTDHCELVGQPGTEPPLGSVPFLLSNCL